MTETSFDSLDTRPPKRRKGEPRRRNCAYCGAEGSTRDHVFPESLFLEKQLDPQMVTVGACKACHDDKTGGDELLYQVVNSEIRGSQHPNAIFHILKTARATERNQSDFGGAFRDSAYEADWVSDAGLVLGRAVHIPDTGYMTLVLKTLGYIVRGLYSYERREKDHMPPDCLVDVQYVEPHRTPTVLQGLQRLPAPGRVVIKRDAIAGWASWQIADAPYSTIYLIGFNNLVFFVGWTGLVAEARGRFFAERAAASENA